MTKTKSRRKTTAKLSEDNELDSVYMLKLVLFLIVGSQWLRFTDDSALTLLPIPIGFLVGLAFAAHDHFRIDRKVEYAVLLVAMFAGFWTQTGIFIRI